LFNKNQLYLWSNVSIFLKNLSVPADISIHIFTKDAVGDLRFGDIYSIVIHQNPQSLELPWIVKEFLSFLFKDLKNLKILVFLYGFLNSWWPPIRCFYATWIYSAWKLAYILAMNFSKNLPMETNFT
jgi:hypothetical protein